MPVIIMIAIINTVFIVQEFHTLPWSFKVTL